MMKHRASHAGPHTYKYTYTHANKCTNNVDFARAANRVKCGALRSKFGVPLLDFRTKLCHFVLSNTACLTP